jgi:predicted transglutaminase-like cysteine proteinase
VLLKRKMLHAHGIPLSDLLITVVRLQDGEGHAVLTVRTGDGDLILDNLNDDVKPWTQTGYRFMKRQSVRYTGRWVSILDNRDVLVSSVN